MNLDAIILVTLALAGLLQNTHAAGYGDSCSDSTPCTPNSYLECAPDINKCVCAGDGYFDGRNCLLLESSNCTTAGQGCVKNAGCRGGYCTCDDKFVSNSEFRCLLPYLSDCSLGDDQCDDDGFQQCGASNGKCECKNRLETVYNEQDKTCQLLASAACGDNVFLTGQECYTNSRCNYERSRCECFEKFQPNQYRQCFVPIGQECRDHEDCDGKSWQECNRNCACIDNPNTVYDSQAQTCKKLVNTNCTLPIGSQPCIQNAVCEEDLRKCVCEGSLEADASRQCYLTFNSTCDVNNDLCNSNKYIECNQATRHCDCKFPTEAVFEAETCKLRAEAFCDPDSQNCISDARCEPAEGADRFRCKCQYDFESNKERKCFLKYGKPCDTFNSKCDSASNLVCISANNTCACAQDMWYDGSSCVAPLSGSCSSDSDCPPNANCHLSQCECNNGYEQYQGTWCLKSYGSPCTSNENECNLDNNLVCIGGICLCQAGHLEEPVGDQIQCTAGYQYPCDATTPCSKKAGLRCSAGRCDCLAPAEQIYSGDRCGSFVGNRCHLNTLNDTTDTLICVHNAECIPPIDDSSVYYGTCQCELGYTVSIFKACSNDANQLHNILNIPVLVVVGLVKVAFSMWH